MKSTTYIRPTRSVADQGAPEQSFDPDLAFADPVGYLAALGVESQLVSLSGPASIQKAA